MAQDLEAGGSPRLADFVGEQFGGDLSYSDEPGTSSSTESATPPASSAPDAATSPAAELEGTAADAPPDTPARALPPSPDTPASPAAVDPLADPFADATPLTYVVDGVTKTYEGIRVLGTDGAVIDSPAVLADLQRKLGERDHLFDANQKLYAENRAYQALGGEQKFAELQQEFAGINAAGNLLVPLISGDVNTILKLLVQNEDGTIGWNEENRRTLIDKIAFAADKAKYESGRTLETSKASAVSQQDQAANDQQQTTQGIQEAVSTLQRVYPHWQQADLDALKTHVTTYAPFLIRKATAEDVAAYPHLTLGTRFIDLPKLQPWADDRERLRASAATTASTVASATKENAARLAAAIRPSPSARPVVAPTAPAPSARASEAGDAWDLMEGLSVSALRGPKA